MISLCPFTKSLVKVFSEVISKVRVSRLLVILCAIVQGLKRVWGFKSKKVLHKNHRKRQLAVVTLNSHLGEINDIFNYYNYKNQLERQV